MRSLVGSTPALFRQISCHARDFRGAIPDKLFCDTKHGNGGRAMKHWQAARLRAETLSPPPGGLAGARMMRCRRSLSSPCMPSSSATAISAGWSTTASGLANTDPGSSRACSSQGRDTCSAFVISASLSSRAARRCFRPANGSGSTVCRLRGRFSSQGFDATMTTATSTPPARATRLYFFFSCSARGKRCVAPT